MVRSRGNAGGRWACEVSRMNLTENVSAFLKKSFINYLHLPKNLEELEAVLHKGLDTICTEYLHELLYAAMPERIERIIKTTGLKSELTKTRCVDPRDLHRLLLITTLPVLLLVISYLLISGLSTGHDFNVC